MGLAQARLNYAHPQTLKDFLRKCRFCLATKEDMSTKVTIDFHSSNVIMGNYHNFPPCSLLLCLWNLVKFLCPVVDAMFMLNLLYVVYMTLFIMTKGLGLCN